MSEFEEDAKVSDARSSREIFKPTHAADLPVGLLPLLRADRVQPLSKKYFSSPLTQITS
ncbi:hypothetical protein [Bradyrhizobium sp.]|jgi:hypothetical protein|uniref:hypothetical protein n=1 Tax=Bradyrhizobium sp. TaxID=376 RepID=UPI003D12E68C